MARENGRGRRGRARAVLIALVLAVVATGGCRVRTEVGIVVHDDGSGVVSVDVGLDVDAAARVGRVEDELRLDDLEATGWAIDGPALEADGLTWVRASKPFSTPAEAAAVLAELGPFRDVSLTRQRTFADTSYSFDGVVDLTGGLEAFGDDALALALDGEPLGEDVSAIEARLGVPIDEAFTLRVRVRLPGGGTQEWTPRLGDATPAVLAVESDVARPWSVALFVGAALLVVAAVGVAVPWRRIFRRRTPRSRGKHAASA